MTWKFKTTEQSKALKDIRNNDFSRYAKICKTLSDECELNASVEFEDNVVDVEDMAIESNINKKIREALEKLSPRESKVLKMRFGIDTSTDHTLEEVGRQFDVTSECIRKLEAKALRKLRKVAPELISCWAS